MNEKHKIFIGYFRADLDTRDIVGFLHKRCPAIEKYEACAKSVGMHGSVRYFLAYVASDKEANKVVRKLDGVVWMGHPLMARVIRERSAFNERRSVDWRNRDWDGPERRRRDRRAYQRKTVERDRGVASFLPEVQMEPGSVSLSDNQAKRLLARARKERESVRRTTSLPERGSSRSYWGFDDHQ